MHGSWHAEVVLTRKFELAGGADAPGIARVEIAELLADRISPVDLLDVTVLVSEVVTNAVRHGHADARDSVVVHVAIAADVLRIEVCDHGPGFSPPANPQPARGRRRQRLDDVAADEQRVGRRDRRRDLRLVRAPGTARSVTPGAQPPHPARVR